MEHIPARMLRGNPTDAELKLWQALRKRQINSAKFRRQHPVGRYIVDFVCLEQQLVIEVDGGQHESQQIKYDAERTHYLELLGFRVLRFWNNEILQNLESVLEVIQEGLEYKPPS